MIKVESFKAAREAADLSQSALARRIGVAQQLIGQLERGEVRTTKHIYKIAQVLGIPASDLDDDIPPFSAHDKRTIPIVGYVGAGAAVFSVDDHEKGGGIDEIDPPFDGLSPSTVAVRVRGDSMLPAYKDGDILLYDRQDSGDLLHLVGKDCVVSLKDGRKFVKQLKRTPNGEWFLHSVNATSEPIFNFEFDWVAKIKIVLKH